MDSFTPGMYHISLKKLKKSILLPGELIAPDKKHFYNEYLQYVSVEKLGFSLFFKNATLGPVLTLIPPKPSSLRDNDAP